MGRFLSLAGLVAVMLFGSALAANAAVTTNETQDFDSVFFVPCAAGGAGELVDLSGRLHVLATLTVNSNLVSGASHVQPQGVRGVGETTGDVYQANGVTHGHFSFSLTDGHGETSFVDTFKLVGRGGAANFSVHETAHLTISADGAVRMAHDHVDIDCG